MDEQPVVPTNNPVTPPAPTPAPAPAAAGSTPLPGVPSAWPGAFGAYKFSRQAVRLNLGAVIVFLLLSGIFTSGGEKVKIIGSIIAVIITSLFTVAVNLVCIAGVRGQRLSIGQAFSQSLPLWLKMIGLMLLVIVSYAVSFALLIVPFFFVLPRLSLASYFLVDKKLGVIEAYKASWAATKGHSANIWGIIGVNFLMVLLVITIIGIPFAIYFLVMYTAATAVYYEYLNKTQPDAVPAQAPATAPSAPSVAPAPPAPIDIPPAAGPVSPPPPQSPTPPPTVG